LSSLPPSIRLLVSFQIDVLAFDLCCFVQDSKGVEETADDGRRRKYKGQLVTQIGSDLKRTRGGGHRCLRSRLSRGADNRYSKQSLRSNNDLEMVLSCILPQNLASTSI